MPDIRGPSPLDLAVGITRSSSIIFLWSLLGVGLCESQPWMNFSCYFKEYHSNCSINQTSERPPLSFFCQILKLNKCSDIHSFVHPSKHICFCDFVLHPIAHLINRFHEIHPINLFHIPLKLSPVHYNPLLLGLSSSTPSLSLSTSSSIIINIITNIKRIPRNQSIQSHRIDAFVYTCISIRPFVCASIHLAQPLTTGKRFNYEHSPDSLRPSFIFGTCRHHAL